MKEAKFDKLGSNLTLLMWKIPVWGVVEPIPTIPPLPITNTSPAQPALHKGDLLGFFPAK